ncbi:transglutaminase domain-containing protein [candidate division CSSED10-310 bacterium]|uniref:Transglutaminase domain-containing protein n=1 Tax=candidate division CSSED10-310 bacterium TaxID=2855610 RepID=A0ABV6YS79_UNCC1
MRIMRFLFLWIPVFLVKLILVLLILGTPLLGFWLASALATYLNGPKWMPLAAGVLLFPILPLFWDLYTTYRRKRRGIERPRTYHFGYRFITRTLVLSILFIGGLVAWVPRNTFIALSTRGDWMLETPQIRQNFSEPQIVTIRQTLFTMANSLEWVYVALHSNPYQKYIEDTDVPRIKPEPQAQETNVLTTQQVTYETEYGGWPWSAGTLHPAVVNMPASVEDRIESVANYIAREETDPFLRVKALHDYVADRVTYDTASLRAGKYPSQSALTVFKTRKSVCAGYANLFAALGKTIGEEVVVISGNSRNQGTDLSGGGHAWNAVKIQDKWFLVDATWDSGYVNNYVFTKSYSTDYLFPPPEIIAITHFPDDAAWQLLPEPLTRGEFLRQPWLKPSFFAEGMRLISPLRSQTDVEDEATLQIKNPQKRYLMAKFGKKGGQATKDCEIKRAEETCITCSLPGSGTYEVELFSSPQQYGTYLFIGRIEFNNQL